MTSTLLGTTSMSTASAHVARVRTPAVDMQVSRPGETWRAYLLRKQAERLADDATRDLPSWTVRTMNRAARQLSTCCCMVLSISSVVLELTVSFLHCRSTTSTGSLLTMQVRLLSPRLLQWCLSTTRLHHHAGIYLVLYAVCLTPVFYNACRALGQAPRACRAAAGEGQPVDQEGVAHLEPLQPDRAGSE